MYPLAIVIALMIGMVVLFDQSMGVEREAVEQRELQTLSSNAAIYLGYVKRYVRSNSGFSGNVPDSVLGLPSWYSKISDLRCHAVSGKGYLYFSNVPERQAFEAAERMQLQYGYGKNVRGVVQMPSGGSFTVPSQVPNGAFVIAF